MRGILLTKMLVLKHCQFNSSSFADDSNGRRSFTLSFQFQVLRHDVVNCVKLIEEWSHAHFMKINPDKTEVLLLYPPSLNSEVIIKGIIFDDQCIRFSEYVKNVGLYVDKNLNMDRHINNTVSHCYKILKDIGMVKKSLQRDHLENIVHAVISQRLDYCNSLFMNISKENLNKLQKVQNSAARLILGRCRRDSATLALRDLHWLNIDSRIVFKIIFLVYKTIRGMSSENLKLQFKSFNGRPEDFLLLHTPNFETCYGKRLFCHGSRLWNALPVDVRTEEDLDRFKKRIKTQLFDGCEELKKKAYKYRS